MRGVAVASALVAGLLGAVVGYAIHNRTGVADDREVVLLLGNPQPQNGSHEGTEVYVVHIRPDNPIAISPSGSRSRCDRSIGAGVREPVPRRN